jgi:hypothetical protein
MPAISAYLEKGMLDWTLGGATPARPNAWWLGLAVGTPTVTSASEMNTLTGYSRLTLSMAAANSPQGSATNLNAMTFGPFSSVGSALGAVLFDGSPVGSSDNLWYGTLATARTFGIGDTLIFAAGALTMTLS